MRTVDPVRHAARRQQILDAAASAIAVKGFDATTVKDLCAAAGVGSGTLFHYFADKRAILHALLAADRDSMRAALESLDVSDPMVALWVVVDLATEDLADPAAGGMAVAILSQIGIDPRVGELLVETDMAVHGVLVGLLERLQAEGRVDPDWSAAHAATWMQGVIDALYLRCADDDFDAAAEVARLRIVLGRMLVMADPEQAPDPEQARPRREVSFAQAGGSE